MRALVLGLDGTLSLSDRPKPAGRGECVIRVTAAGICGTDIVFGCWRRVDRDEPIPE